MTIKEIGWSRGILVSITHGTSCITSHISKVYFCAEDSSLAFLTAPIYLYFTKNEEVGVLQISPFHINIA
jgi:hypothetical protein